MLGVELSAAHRLLDLILSVALWDAIIVLICRRGRGGEHMWRWVQPGTLLSPSTQWDHGLNPGCDPPQSVLPITILFFLLMSLCCVPGIVPSLHIHSFYGLILTISWDIGVMTTILKILKERFKMFKHLSQYHKVEVASVHQRPQHQRVTGQQEMRWDWLLISPGDFTLFERNPVVHWALGRRSSSFIMAG